MLRARPPTGCMFRLLVIIVLLVTVLFFTVEAKATTKELPDDYFKMFNQSRGRPVDTKEVKKIYRKLSMEYHPDRNKDPDAEKKFMKISQAYEVMMDDEKRRVYERDGEEGLKNSGSGQGFHDPFDIFAQFAGFGGSRRRQGQDSKPKAPPIHLPIKVTLEEVNSGATIEIDIEKQVLCPLCDGSGAKTGRDVIKCSTCNGNGIRVQRIAMGPFIQQMQSTCDVCQGKGKVIKDKCSLCKGVKVSKNHREVSVPIRKGIKNGETIIVEEAGDEHPDRLTGDIIFTVETEPHAIYERKGDNLYVIETITLVESLLGFKHSLSYFGKTFIDLESTGITQPGFVKVLDGYGLPRRRLADSAYSSEEELGHDDMSSSSVLKDRGKLYITYQVLYPESLSKVQLDALQVALGSTKITNIIRDSDAIVPQHVDL